ncbi:carotenoid cleavage dioxygenase 1 like protein [Zymoseptoria brevis]|uniref:Carotenoid cleavage dioxygenase 1 like protein n=1 Tax=Zymoseptoria brevis TaxID=1047168 RepID=A0A0F4G9R0_9PEZI|nr:carotenoid cleavage dioxygenase 1 like protein [Zymoseptoria brevis]
MGDVGTMNDSATMLPNVDFKTAQHTEQQLQPSKEQHYKNWPNAGAFNALGDTRTKVDLSTSGAFPSYVAGTLYRTGPGGYKVPRSNPKDGFMACHHWFDGFFTTHKFDLTAKDNGACDVSYRSVCHVDEAIESARKTGKLEGDTFYKKLKTIFEPVIPGQTHRAAIGVAIREILPAEAEEVRKQLGSNSTPVNVLNLTTDHSAVKTIDADTLEPLGVTRQEHLHPSLAGQLSAAHAEHDPITGEDFNHNLAMGRKDVYRVFCVNPATGKVDILAELTGPDFKAAYIHSMFLTKNFVVLCIWPAYLKGIKVLWEKNLMDAMSFDPSAKATWCVIDRHYGRGLVTKFRTPAFFSFHSTNAFEEVVSNSSTNGGAEVDIICELVTFENADILRNFYYDNLVSNGPNITKFLKSAKIDATLARYKLAAVPLTAKVFSQASKTSHPAERILAIDGGRAGDLPVTNPLYALQPHRYVWSILNRGKSSFVDGLVKTDTLTGEARVWEQDKHSPGEPIFVPRPGAEAEDEGALLSVVFNGETGSSYLLCLDARTMEEVARAEVGTAVGFGFHGRHVPKRL